MGAVFLCVQESYLHTFDGISILKSHWATVGSISPVSLSQMGFGAIFSYRTEYRLPDIPLDTGTAICPQHQFKVISFWHGFSYFTQVIAILGSFNFYPPTFIVINIFIFIYIYQTIDTKVKGSGQVAKLPLYSSGENTWTVRDSQPPVEPPYKTGPTLPLYNEISFQQKGFIHK